MKLQRNKDIIIHNENSGNVLLNLSNGNFYGVHDLSLDIWEMLGDISEANTIVDKIAEKYIDIDKEQISNDVNLFLKELLKEGLIKEYEENI